MGKKKKIDQLTNLLSCDLRHRIGSIVNKEDIYAAKYAKDAEIIIKQAKKVLRTYNWNKEYKEIIRKILRKKLRSELEKKDFLDNKKFDIMDKEMEKVLKRLNLS
jgi:hypothetical protein